MPRSRSESARKEPGERRKCRVEPLREPAPWEVVPPAGSRNREGSTASVRLFGRRRSSWDDLRYWDRVAWINRHRHRLPKSSVGTLKRLEPTCSCLVRGAESRPELLKWAAGFVARESKRRARRRVELVSEKPQQEEQEEEDGGDAGTGSPTTPSWGSFKPDGNGPGPDAGNVAAAIPAQ